MPSSSAAPSRLHLPRRARSIAKLHRFQLKGYAWGAAATATAENAYRVALVQTKSLRRVWSHDPAEHRRRALAKTLPLVSAAAAAGARLVVLPECWDIPYIFAVEKPADGVPDDALWAENADHTSETNNATLTAVREWARELKIHIACPRIEVSADGRLHNVLAVIDDEGAVVGRIEKAHIPPGRSAVRPDCREGDVFAPSTDNHPVVPVAGTTVLLGSTMCYDRWHPLSWLLTRLHGANVIANSCAITTQGKRLWTLHAQHAAVTNGVYALAVNKVGTELFDLRKHHARHHDHQDLTTTHSEGHQHRGDEHKEKEEEETSEETQGSKAAVFLNAPTVESLTEQTENLQLAPSSHDDGGAGGAGGHSQSAVGPTDEDDKEVQVDDNDEHSEKRKKTKKKGKRSGSKKGECAKKKEKKKAKRTHHREHYIGRSFVAGPDGRLAPTLSGRRAGVLVAALDMSLGEQEMALRGLRATARLGYYARQLGDVAADRITL